MKKQIILLVAGLSCLTAGTMPHDIRVRSWLVHRHHHHWTLRQRKYLLRRVMFCEARNQGVAGMLAVGHVVLNRVHENKRRYGFHIEGVVLKKYAFSCMLKSDPSYQLTMHPERLILGSPDASAWAETKPIADMLLRGATADPTRGAEMYHTPAIHPWWVKHMRFVTRFAGHLFYSDSQA